MAIDMQKTILLVDDDEEEFFIIKLALEMAAFDCQCVWANGLDEATQMVKELQPDFVFIDINMPRHDGISCLKRLKQLEQLEHLRQSVFVIYSTYISQADHKKASHLGASCLHKPEDIHTLLKHLSGLLSDRANYS